MLEVLAHLDDAVEVAADQLALADLLGRDARLFRQDAVGQLLGRHFEREEADHGTVRDLGLPILAVLLAIGLHGVERDVGGERGLSHRGTAGQDQKIGLVQAAQQLVELAQTGGHAGQLAGAVVGGLGGAHRIGQGLAERLEAAVGLADAGQVIELLLGDLDLLDRGFLERRLEGAVHYVLAQRDQLAQQEEVVHQPAEVAGVDHVHRRSRQARQIGRAASGLHVVVVFDVGLQGDRADQLAPLDQPGEGVEQLAVQRIGEMLTLEEFRDPVIGGVVDQDRAQQRLLRLEVVRRFADGRELDDPAFGCLFVFLGLHGEPFNRERGARVVLS